jgi:hypothetical protein
MSVVHNVKIVCAYHLHLHFAWDTFSHPPYSPILALGDFHFFTHLKQFWGGTRMRSDEEVKTVKDRFNGLAADFYVAGITETRHTV